jgi:hypothetical protein
LKKERKCEILKERLHLLKRSRLMKQLYLILILTFLCNFCFSQQPQEIRLTLKSANKFIADSISGYVKLFDEKDFQNKIEKVLSKNSKVVLSKIDLDNLKTFLNSYFITNDTLYKLSDSIPENIRSTFYAVFIDYIQYVFPKGYLMVFNKSRNSYEEKIVQLEKEHVTDNMLGFKLNENVSFRNKTTSFVTSDGNELQSYSTGATETNK